jgi:hypothetical protein
MTSFPENIITLFKFSTDQHCFKVVAQSHCVNNMTSIGDVELRSIVKFCAALEKSSTETMKMINSTGKYKKCSPATVYRWHARFKEGRNPRYSPDLAPMDFRVFPELKSQLRGKRFDLVKHTQAIVSSFTDSWYVETYNKWISRQRKFIEIAGDYVEKVRRSMDFNVA